MSTFNDDNARVEIKSKFETEFRRFSLEKNKTIKFTEFHNLLENLHKLKEIAFAIYYIDLKDEDLLPITNDENLAVALNHSKPLLRLVIQRKGEGCEEYTNYGTIKRRNLIATVLGTPFKQKPLSISSPHNFRQVSSIIDVDIVPATCRRVRLVKKGSDKPLGFYIRDGASLKATSNGLERIPGIFISRLINGGLAESSGLLAVNDEVLEVNGIEVADKTLDQVTDMMLANRDNLIITVKPANQRTVGTMNRGSFTRKSQKSNGSHQSCSSDELDEIVDMTKQYLDMYNSKNDTILRL
ncbi:partitioning defective 6 homolog beta-like [Aethina tumida]|uniref:partitioning defective 6 homolog beta-like n=1 Tax=Aethina tumida TaxID=116153 RepID=UPI00214909BA|nr:partitioning defective 6 homolog beta-like [Aethina tumida]